MAVIVRLLLLFMIALGGQSLAFCQTGAEIYSYDGFPNVSDKRYAPLRLDNSGYDVSPNFPNALGSKVQERSFFALVDGFFVTKGAVQEVVVLRAAAKGKETLV